jgi:hypothetical protein
MANARAENFPVYLAEGTCNASQQAEVQFFSPEPSATDDERQPRRFGRKIEVLAIFLLQTK